MQTSTLPGHTWLGPSQLPGPVVGAGEAEWLNSILFC